MTAMALELFSRVLAEEQREARMQDSGAARNGTRGWRSAASCKLSLVTDRAGFNALESEWNRLFERAGSSIHMFQSFNWNWHWCNHYLAATHGKGPTLAIVVGRRDGRVVMIWPLVTERVMGLKQLSWMGAPVSQYGDVLVENVADRQQLLEDAWAFIARELKPDVVKLRKVREDASIATLLTAVGAVSTEHQIAPFLELSSAQDFASYEQRYSAQSRRNRKRLMRRLEEKGEVSFEELSGGTAAKALATTAIDMKQIWLKARGLVSPAFADSRFRDFFADVAEAGEHATDCRVSALRIDGAPVAIEIAVGCKGRRALHVIVHDLTFEKSGVGVLLLEQCIRDAFRGGYECYDLLAPGADYKSAWADGAVDVADRSVGLSVAGQLYSSVYLGFVRRHAKGLIARLPLVLRRMIA